MKKLSNEDIDLYLLSNNRQIQRIGEVNGSRIKIDWKCLVVNCSNIWATTTDNIKAGYGCPKCSGCNPTTNENMDQWLLDNKKSIKRIDDVSRALDKINWECLALNCNYKWEARPNDIKSGYGCPQCTGKVRLTNNIVDQWLIDNKKLIKRVDNIKGTHTNINWICLNTNCNHIWSATPGSIKNGERGCPKCNLPGYNEKLILNFLAEKEVNFEWQKNIKELNANETRPLKIDFYFPTHKVALEYNGIQHYQPAGFGSITAEQAKINFSYQQERDEYKRIFCKKNNILLVEIDGRYYRDNKLIEYLENFLSKELVS